MVCYLYPNFFTPLETKSIAESLEYVLIEDQKGTYRLSAIELVGLGFTVWQTYLNGATLIKSLISFAAFMESGIPATGNTTSMKYISRQSLFEISRQSPELFIQTVTQELSHSKLAYERGMYLHVISFILSKVIQSLKVIQIDHKRMLSYFNPIYLKSWKV